MKSHFLNGLTSACPFVGSFIWSASQSLGLSDILLVSQLFIGSFIWSASQSLGLSDILLVSQLLVSQSVGQ